MTQNDLTEQGNTPVELLMSDSLGDKFHLLNIGAELPVSFLSGMIKFSGHAKFVDGKDRRFHDFTQMT